MDGGKNMGKMTGGGKSPLFLFVWVVLTVALAAAAYLTGSALAEQWVELPLSTPVPAPTVAPVSTGDVSWLSSGSPVEGTLGGAAGDAWEFMGREGQSATVEMWLYPGSGSDVEAELAVSLLAPDGTVLTEETGSVFLLPYVFQPRLPDTGLYTVRVVPLSGAPGRYSLLLSLAAALTPVAPGVPPQPQLTATAPGSQAASVAQGMFQWPTTRRSISGWTFHDPRNPGHIGLDIAARMWDPIVAAADGVVVFAEWGGGYGNLVIVEHADGWRTYYAHFSEIVVEVGQEVRQGELLGGAGTTGHSTGPHLHFEIRYQGRPVDPQLYLP